MKYLGIIIITGAFLLSCKNSNTLENKNKPSNTTLDKIQDSVRVKDSIFVNNIGIRSNILEFKKYIGNPDSTGIRDDEMVGIYKTLFYGNSVFEFMDDTLTEFRIVDDKFSLNYKGIIFKIDDSKDGAIQKVKRISTKDFYILKEDSNHPEYSIVLCVEPELYYVSLNFTNEELKSIRMWILM